MCRVLKRDEVSPVTWSEVGSGCAELHPHMDGEMHDDHGNLVIHGCDLFPTGKFESGKTAEDLMREAHKRGLRVYTLRAKETILFLAFVEVEDDWH